MQMAGKIRIELLAFVLLAVAACSDNSEAPDEGATGAGQICQSESPVEVLNVAAEVVEEAPGFAGCLPDDGNPGQYILNATVSDVDIEGVRSTLARRYPADRDWLDGATFTLNLVDASAVPGLYDEVWTLMLNSIPPDKFPAYRPVFRDLKEDYNQITIGYASEEARGWAQQFILDQVDAPLGTIVPVYVDVSGDDD